MSLASVIAICRMLLTAIWHILTDLKPYTSEGFLEQRLWTNQKSCLLHRHLICLNNEEFLGNLYFFVSIYLFSVIPVQRCTSNTIICPRYPQLVHACKDSRSANYAVASQAHTWRGYQLFTAGLMQRCTRKPDTASAVSGSFSILYQNL